MMIRETLTRPTPEQAKLLLGMSYGSFGRILRKQRNKRLIAEGKPLPIRWHERITASTLATASEGGGLTQ